MSDPDFLDTSILAYAYDTTDARKRQIAQDLIRTWSDGAVVLSVQVLSELTAILLHKSSRPAKRPQVEEVLLALEPLPVVTPDAAMVRRAVEARAKYGVHFYDGMIIAAAERAGCKRIWSENFNAGQKYFEIAVENPFSRP